MIAFVSGFIVGGLAVGLVAINNHTRALALRARLMAYTEGLEPIVGSAWGRLLAWLKGLI